MGTKSKGNRADRKTEDDGHVATRDSDGDRVKSTSKEKKSKDRSVVRNIEGEGRLPDVDRVKSSSKEKESKDRSAERAVEDDSPLLIRDSDAERVKSSSKEKKRKRSRAEMDIEQDVPLLTSDSDGSSSKSLSKEKKSRRNLTDREIENGGHLLTIDSEGGNLNSSSKEKKIRKRRVDRELEHDIDSITSDSDGDRIKSSSMLKKCKRSCADAETEHDGQLITSDSDGDRLKHEVASPDRTDSLDVGSSLAKKMKKTVRFRLPEIEEMTQQEEEEESENDEEEDKENLSFFDNEKFSLQVSDLDEGRGWQKDKLRTDLKYGYFSKEEDEKLKTAIYDVIERKNWEEAEGVQMLLKPRRHPEARGCWLDIAKFIPERPVKQLYVRAERLVGQYKRGKWSTEELERLRELVGTHGHNWKIIQQEMGRSAALCKDRWRALRINSIARQGKWTESEFDFLCAYVRWSMKLKDQLGAKNALDHRNIRDDVNWEVIAEKMLRPSSVCAKIWYQKLASSLVNEGCWANGDDRRLLRSLLESGASSEEAVDWDQLLDDRDGATCEKRWNQMKKLVYEPGAHFEDKLQLVTRRYAPDLIGIEDDFNLDAVTVAGDIQIVHGKLKRQKPRPEPAQASAPV